MKTWVLLLLGCMLATSGHAQSRRVVYQWKDANGVTHFSDYPQPGARQITLNGAPTSSSPPATAQAESSAAAATRRPVQYVSLTIVSPDNDATFFEADAEVLVRVQPEPALDRDDRLVTYLDGRELGDINQLEHSLSNLDRGTHTLQSVIYDRDGAEKIRSSRITFHMRQTSIANPRNQGPSVRPPPRPKPR